MDPVLVKVGGRTGEVLSAFDYMIHELGYVPSLRQLGRRLGISAPTVKYHLDKLRSQGLVFWTPHQPRTLHRRKEK